MHLTRMGEQGPETLLEFYRDLAEPDAQRSPDINAHWHEYAEHMMELVGAIETHVSAPMHYCTTSHASFYMTEQDCWFHDEARVWVGYRDGLYHIDYRTKREIIDGVQEYIRIRAATVSEAVEAVQYALDNAERNLVSVRRRPSVVENSADGDTD